MLRRWLPLLVLGLLASTPGFLSAQDQTLEQRVTTDFPFSLTFHVEAHVPQEIIEAVVRFRVEERSCVQVESTGYAQFQRGRQISAQWTWDMRKTGGLPPGAVVHYQWRLTDASGSVIETPLATIEVVDQRHPWQRISEGDVILYWYRGDERFATALLEAAQDTLARLKASTGADPEKPVRLYIYGSTDDLRSALVYPQEWTGGVSFSSFNIIAIGIEPESLAWGRRATAHEITHVIIGQVTHNCYRALPAWLSEGLATYHEGDPSSVYARSLESGIQDNRLLSVRSLGSAFPTDEQDALLAYGESQSLVEYLIQAFGPAKLEELLTEFRSGTTADPALQEVYGFDQVGLEEKWRRFLGASPMSGATPDETPVSSVPVLPTFEPFTLATPAPTPTRTVAPGGNGGLSCSAGLPSAANSGTPGKAALSLPTGFLALGLLAIINRRRKG